VNTAQGDMTRMSGFGQERSQLNVERQGAPIRTLPVSRVRGRTHRLGGLFMGVPPTWSPSDKGGQEDRREAERGRQ
jgi:hypothetical protein